MDKLKVTMALGSPLISNGGYMTLDALLAAQLFDQTGDLEAAHSDIPLRNTAGLWHASAAIFEPLEVGRKGFVANLRASHDLDPDLLAKNAEGKIHRKLGLTRSSDFGAVLNTYTLARMGSNTVLIAAGAWAGLDTPTHWASVVVPRIPFERPVVLDAQEESSFLDARNAALRRMRQVVGRGLRTPQAVCSVYILDGRYKNLQAFVPQRFRQAWNSKVVLEGGRVEVLLSKLERDPSVRKRALAHYGALCQGCGFSPKVPSQLDVHHLRPLADGGERLTGLQDLAVLCANCHRLAHAAHPPLALEAIRVLHAIE